MMSAPAMPLVGLELLRMPMDHQPSMLAKPYVSVRYELEGEDSCAGVSGDQYRRTCGPPDALERRSSAAAPSGYATLLLRTHRL